MIEFKSCLSDKMEAFCDLRRLCGTTYSSQARLLMYFDQHLGVTEFTGSVLRRGVVDSYMLGLNHLKPRTRANRLGVVRQFCQYLALHAPDCYVPDQQRSLSSSEAYCPHIFSQEEIRALMTAAKALPPADSLRGLTLATVYGLLFITGLRISEALALDVQDFHRDSSCLFIRKGKFRKSRWIALDQTTARALCHFLAHRESRLAISASDPLFINLRGRRLSQCSVRKPFRALLLPCGIQVNPAHPPRLHDLRHSFAVRRLVTWYSAKEDVNSLLPALTTYMGHVSVASTQRYIHATPELYQQAFGRSLQYVRSHIYASGGQP